MPRRLSLVIHSLEGGGAERVMASMASHWAALGDEVTLITLAAASTDAYPLDERVQRVALNLMADSAGVVAAVSNNWRRIRAIRQALRNAKPDYVIAFTQVMNILTQLAASSTGYPVVLSERADPRQHPLGRSWSGMRRITYPSCRALVVQTHSVAEYFSSYVPRNRIHVIPNGVDANAAIDPVESQRAAQTKPQRIIGLGRLSHEKGFDLLIEAFSQIATRHADWTLAIYGEGPARSELEQLIESKGLNGRVKLPGWCERPSDVLQASGLFVLPSRYEGFPNSLLEAMSMGLPAVSFDCQSGPADIIRHDVDGLLAKDGDVDSLSQAMSKAMADESLQMRLGQAAREVADRFSMEKFFSRWKTLLSSL